MNKINLIGRMTAQVEAKSYKNGNKMGLFTLAVDRDYKNNGEKITDFFNCVCNEGLLKVLENYTNKGSLIGISGNLYTSKYKDKDGNNRVSYSINVTDVYLLESKKSQENSTDYDNLPF